VPRGTGDLAVILYTSGTTGAPKGVALSHDNLESNARASARLYELDRAEWAVGVLPLSHSYGLTVMNAGHILGTRAALLRWFSPEAVLETIHEFRATAMSAVPTMLIYLLNYPEAGRFDTSTMRAWGSGAAPLPVEIVEPFERKFGGRILEGYGLTEAAPVVAAHRLSGVRKLGSVGQSIPGVSVSIQDDGGRRLPAGEVGEVCVQGPNVMLGYYRNTADTAEALRGAGCTRVTWDASTPTAFSTSSSARRTSSSAAASISIRATSRRRSMPIPRWPRPLWSGRPTP